MATTTLTCGYKTRGLINDWADHGPITRRSDRTSSTRSSSSSLVHPGPGGPQTAGHPRSAVRHQPGLHSRKKPLHDVCPLIFLFVIAGFGNYVGLQLMLGGAGQEGVHQRLSRLDAPARGRRPCCWPGSDSGTPRCRLDQRPPLDGRRWHRRGPGRTCALADRTKLIFSRLFLGSPFQNAGPRGMTLFRMPIMVWTVLVTSVLVLIRRSSPAR